MTKGKFLCGKKYCVIGSFPKFCLIPSLKKAYPSLYPKYNIVKVGLMGLKKNSPSWTSEKSQQTLSYYA